jgi:hypothetical protein
VVQSGKESLQICVTSTFHLDRGGSLLLTLISPYLLADKWQRERLGLPLSTHTESDLPLCTICLPIDTLIIHNINS